MRIALFQRVVRAIHALLVASLLAGLLPPPLLPAVATTLVNATLPDALATSVAEQIDAAAARLPNTAQIAQAAPNAAPPAAPPAAPLHQSSGGINELTITKTIRGTGSGPFDLTIAGPSGYFTTTQIDGGETKLLTGLASGVYTVTESMPGVGWTTVYTATPGAGGGSTTSSVNGVVELQNTLAPATFGPTAISGQVYTDIDFDGVLDSGEANVAGVTVTAYDTTGATVGTAVSAANGAYTINPSAAGPYRLNFTNLPSGAEPGKRGTSNGTSTRFITSAAGASNLHFGIHYPAEYHVGANSYFVAEMWNGANTDGGNWPTTVNIPYTNSGGPPAGQINTPTSESQTGSIWGLAYSPKRNRLYSAAFLRRHVGLGPSGLGAIYVTTNPGTGNPASTSALTTVSNVGTVSSNASRGLGSRYNPTTDPSVFGLVGTVGLGDLDISADEEYLYTVNLNTKQVIIIDIDNPASKTAVAIPNPNCSNGVFRPFALKVHRGKLYVGGVCDGSGNANSDNYTNANLAAYVYVMNTTNNTFNSTPVLNFPLNYAREAAWTAFANYPQSNSSQWWPWRNTYKFNSGAASPPNSANNFGLQFCGGCGNVWMIVTPTPMLTDLEISDSGDLILGFADRTTQQFYSSNYAPNSQPSQLVKLIAGGEILRATANSNGSFTIESPLNSTSEFFNDDLSIGDHLETASGGLAVRRGDGQVLSTAMDPLEWNSQGTYKLRTTNGTRVSGLTFWRESALPYPEKGSSLGDIELLTQPAPIEIGNRVWNDINGNGVQDPGESGINGVTVSLYNSNNALVGTTTTSGDGNYYFTNLASNTAYTIKIGTPPTGYSLTTPNATALNGASVTGNDAINDTIDSDATLVGGAPTILYTTGGPGQNNHGLDFGFVQPATGLVEILNIAPEPLLALAALQLVKVVEGGSVSAPFSVTVTGPHGYNTMVSVTAGTPTELTNLEVGQYTVMEASPPASSAPAGYQWAGVSYAPAGGLIALSSGMTGTITVTNYLGAEPVAPTSGLTVTKSVDWNGNTPNGSQQFAYTIAGPNGFTPINGSISDGGVMTYSVPLGVYTVTEISPGAGWTTVYTATSGYNTGSSAVVTLTNAITAATFIKTQITGRVFNDYSSDGLITANGFITDTGVQNVSVTAYGMSGANCGSTQSDMGGYYTLTTAILTCDGPYRIAFTDLPAGYEPSRSGTQNGTAVQFVTDVANANNVNLGVHHPADYCQENPDLCLSIALNGDPANATVPRGVIAAVPYFAPTASVSQLPDPLGSYLANKSDVGAVWGMAYNKASQIIYSSAYLKRHTGLREGLAANPLGAIYQTDANATTLFVDLSTFGINVGSMASNTTRGLGAPNAPSRDPQSYAQIGKIGIGDIDISDDGRILYAMSLNDTTVYAVNIANKTLVGAYPLTVVNGVNTCTGGELRPFALKFYRSQLYVGTVCDASSSQATSDLQASVYSLDLTSGLYSSVLDIPLNYVKGDISSGCPKSTADNRLSNWNAWLDTPPTIYCATTSGTRTIAYPQPMLADIEVDIDGSLILGFRDRTGDQWGPNNLHPTNVDSISYNIISGGDILRACKQPTGFALPGSAECPNTSNNDEGPGGGEYYTGDFIQVASGGGHREISFGSVALLPGSNQTALAVMDPNLRYSTGGIKWFNNITGSAERGLEVYGNGVTGYFNKANGMGDIEVLCDSAPIEIGNRVWYDIDHDGEQDAGEPGINGLTVTLQTSTGISTTTTSGDGNYSFSVEAHTAYTITVATPGSYSLTAANATALDAANLTSNDAISDTIDSDALLVNDVPTIRYTTGSPGQNNHGLDFGFVQPVIGQVDILNTAPAVAANPSLAVSKQLNGVSPFGVGENISFSIRITNTGDVAITTLPLEDRFSSAFITFVSANPAPDVVNGGILTWNNLLAGDPDGLAANEVMTVDVTFTTAADTTLLAAMANCSPAGQAPNLAHVSNALAGGAPVVTDGDDEDCASVQILNPTAVQLAERSLTQTPEGVLVRWAMVEESNVVGFYLWRSNGVESARRSELIPTGVNGQAGSAAAYQWLDAGATLARGDAYVLEIVKADGSSERVVIDVVKGGSLYLPLITR